MPPDVDTLRLRALTVPGVTRLADHHDGIGRPPRPTSYSALRVFDRHVEIDIVLAADHAVPATTAALRAALSPLLAGRSIHITVIDVDTTGPRSVSPDTDAAGPLPRARAVAHAVLAQLGSVTAEGLPATQRRAVTSTCRIIIAYDVDPVSRRVLVQHLRDHLAAARGPVGRGLIEQLEAIDDVDESAPVDPGSGSLSGARATDSCDGAGMSVASDLDGQPRPEPFLPRHVEQRDPSVEFFTAERFVVVAYDPQTDEMDSYGPYDGRTAVTECRRRRAAFDDGDLDDVVVVVVPLWTT